MAHFSESAGELLLLDRIALKGQIYEMGASSTSEGRGFQEADFRGGLGEDFFPQAASGCQGGLLLQSSQGGGRAVYHPTRYCTLVVDK